MLDHAEPALGIPVTLVQGCVSRFSAYLIYRGIETLALETFPRVLKVADADVRRDQGVKLLEIMYRSVNRLSRTDMELEDLLAAQAVRGLPALLAHVRAMAANAKALTDTCGLALLRSLI